MAKYLKARLCSHTLAAHPKWMLKDKFPALANLVLHDGDAKAQEANSHLHDVLHHLLS